MANFNNRLIQLSSRIPGIINVVQTTESHIQKNLVHLPSVCSAAIKKRQRALCKMYGGTCALVHNAAELGILLGRNDPKRAPKRQVLL